MFILRLYLTLFDLILEAHKPERLETSDPVHPQLAKELYSS